MIKETVIHTLFSKFQLTAISAALLCVFFGMAATATPAHAQLDFSNSSTLFEQSGTADALAEETTLLGDEDPVTISINLINIVVFLLGIVVVSLIIYGGFTWLTAAGNADQVANAKRILTQAVIGLIIVLASWGGTIYVMNIARSATGLDPSFDVSAFDDLALGTTAPTTVAENVIIAVLSFLAFIIVGLFIYAGIMWMTAAGNSDRVDTAKRIMIAAVIGLVIVLGSLGITIYLIDTAAIATGGLTPEIDG